MNHHAKNVVSGTGTHLCCWYRIEHNYDMVDTHQYVNWHSDGICMQSASHMHDVTQILRTYKMDFI